MAPINTALTSFGMSGWVFHAPFINLHPEFNFYAVLERTKNLAVQKYPDVITFRTLEDLLNDKLVELVVVNSPNFTHYDFAKKALEAGKHVIVEKPFALTVLEGLELIALAKQRNLKLSVYHNRRYDSDFKTVRKVVLEKLLGDIVEAEIHYDRFTTVLGPKLHKETPGPGTGLLYDLGSHSIDQTLQMFGMPEEVFADIHIIRPISKVEDYMEVLLYYPGLRVRLKGSYLVREPIPAYSVFGNKGSFLKSRSDVQEGMLLAGASPGAKNWGEDPEEEKGLLHTEIEGEVIRERLSSERGNYMEYYDGIYQALRHNGELPVNPEDAVNVLRVIEAAYQSNREKRVVSIKE